MNNLVMQNYEGLLLQQESCQAAWMNLRQLLRLLERDWRLLGGDWMILGEAFFTQKVAVVRGQLR